MKKMTSIIALLTALLVCFASLAMAENVPSKTTGDMTVFTATAENADADTSAFFITAVREETAAEHPDLADKCSEELTLAAGEIAKLAAAPTLAEYFGKIYDSEGNDITEALLSSGDFASVNEFCAVIDGGYTDDMGNMTVTMQFATPYEEGEKVMVLVGIMQEDNTIAWTAFDGVGIAAEDGKPETAGRIQAVLTPEILTAMETSDALLAILSK